MDYHNQTLQVEDVSPVINQRCTVHELYEQYPQLKSDHFHWNQIIDNASYMTIPAGTELMRPESPCIHFMLLIKGSVRVFQQTPNDREATLYRTHSGDLCVLSINGMMQHKNFDAFAKAETEVVAISFTRDQFMQAMAVYEPFREYVLISLTSRFQNVLELMEEVVFENLDTRLVCMLARLADENGTRSINITHLEIARELGSTREVISRLLKSLEKQNCLRLGRGVIHVLI